MLQVQNETPFVPGIFLFPDARGVDTLFLALKATFELGRDGPVVAQKQQPLVLSDEYWGEPGQTSLKYASEAHLLKPGTDVVVVGEAFAPKGRPVPSSLVSVKVGALPSPSSPEPFLRMPLLCQSFAGTYDEAWQKQRAPYLPLDFKADFFLSAPPELCARQFLKGGERAQA